MAWWNPFSNRTVGASEDEPVPLYKTATKVGASPFAVMAAGIDNIVKDTEGLRSTTYNNTNNFDLYDEMLNYDPELNGAVRTISLTANKYKVIGGKNGAIRNAIKELTEETLEFDDMLISGMRNLMVYGNDISKLVGRTGVGITNVQSLPISQITIVDNRRIPFAADKDNAIYTPDKYLLRENARDSAIYPASEILHIKIDYRSYWFMDRMGRWTYGVWGASRFSALKQAIRAKYNSMNNRIALEDSLTKQYITIGPEAIANIQDPAEAQERLNKIMDDVGSLLDGLRADQVPILPHYVNMQFVDLKNTIPDNSAFMDQVNADISSVLHVPRVSMGQERGSTFAATFNASQWSVQAIRRLQKVLSQAVQGLFSKHLELLGIPHKMGDLPKLAFDPIDEESPFETTRRVVLAYEAGITTLNEARDDLNLMPERGTAGKSRGSKSSKTTKGDLPRENENKGE
tara:strand:+ start:1161 stop:2540 length:1380 start_codon:yes stop_codon:yes gene_type:complete